MPVHAIVCKLVTRRRNERARYLSSNRCTRRDNSSAIYKPRTSIIFYIAFDVKEDDIGGFMPLHTLIYEIASDDADGCRRIGVNDVIYRQSK